MCCDGQVTDKVYSQDVIDAAQRVADGMNLAAVALDADVLFRSYLTFNLSDGRTDNCLYQSREDAMAHTRNGPPVMILSTREAPGGMDLRSALSVLTYHRALKDGGYDQNRAMIVPLERNQVGGQIRRIIAANGRDVQRYRR